jgi:hypothetical protein
MNNQQREKIAEYVIALAVEGLNSSFMQAIIKSAESAKKFYQSQFKKYLDLNAYLSREKFKACDFWFNDAGLQYKWRDSDSVIVLECLNWAEVVRRVKKISKKEK